MRKAIFPFVMPVMIAALVFPAAGRIDLPFFWLAVGIPIVVGLALGPFIDEELIRERMNPAPGGCDRHLRTLGAPLFFIMLIVAALDAGRYHWSDTVPLPLQVAGMAAFAAGLSFSAWALIVNRFFSPVVRLQSERGHHVVTTGPYAWVRHPGYAGGFFGWTGLTLGLGSWLALLPLLPMYALMVRRILIEDRFLHENLEGYRDYAARVRYRLWPGVW